MDYSVSVIVPVRDEAGTILAILPRMPVMGKFTEIIFAESHSKDGSWAQIKRMTKYYSGSLKIKAIRHYEKKGKAASVWQGFGHARGDILMILDADMSVLPEELSKFYKMISTGRYQIINGSRFLSSKEKGSMRFFNHLGNKFFAMCFSIILKQKITDTLCGTKVLFRKDFLKMQKLYPGVFATDPYGDFALLLGAAKLSLDIAEVPVNYKARIYGKSKINPFIDGLKLFILLAKDFKNVFFLKK